MDYIQKNLVMGEAVLYKTRLHWIVLVWPLIAGLFVGGIGLALWIGGYEANVKGTTDSSALITAGILFVIGASALVGAGFIRGNATEIAVSNMRVLIKRGVLRRKSIEVLLPKVESIGVDESIVGRMLGYGSVIVRGTGGTFETFRRIARPNEFRRKVQQQIGTR